MNPVPQTNQWRRSKNNLVQQELVSGNFEVSVETKAYVTQ